MTSNLIFIDDRAFDPREVNYNIQAGCYETTDEGEKWATWDHNGRYSIMIDGEHFYCTKEGGKFRVVEDGFLARPCAACRRIHESIDCPPRDPWHSPNGNNRYLAEYLVAGRLQSRIAYKAEQ